MRSVRWLRELNRYQPHSNIILLVCSWGGLSLSVFEKKLKPNAVSACVVQMMDHHVLAMLVSLKLLRLAAAFHTNSLFDSWWQHFIPSANRE